MKTYVKSREINVTLREDAGSAKIGPNIIMIYESILGCNMLGPDNHIKGTSEHTKRMDLMICLGKKPNPTQEVPYETIIRGFRSAWQQQFVRNH
jgi:hypothetical protein